MDSLRRLWGSLRSRSPRFQAGVVLGVAVLAGVLLAFAGGGDDASLDEGEAASADSTTLTDSEEFPIRKVPELVQPDTSEKPARRKPIKLVDRPLPETEARVRRIFRRQVAASSRAGLLVSELQRVSCDEDGACRVEYVADGPGTGKVIESQGAIWRELFANRRVREATLVANVGGPDAAAGGSVGAKPVVVRCDRSAINTIRDIGRNAGPHVKRECEVSARELPGR